MKEEPVPKGLFDSAGGPQEEVSPDIPESADAKGKETGFLRRKSGDGRKGYRRREIIDGMLDHPRDEELEDVDDEQRQKPDEELPSVLQKSFLRDRKAFIEDDSP